MQVGMEIPIQRRELCLAKARIPNILVGLSGASGFKSSSSKAAGYMTIIKNTCYTHMKWPANSQGHSKTVRPERYAKLIALTHTKRKKAAEKKNCFTYELQFEVDN